jgi:hypothetical protein
MVTRTDYRISIVAIQRCQRKVQEERMNWTTSPLPGSQSCRYRTEVSSRGNFNNGIHGIRNANCDQVLANSG